MALQSIVCVALLSLTSSVSSEALHLATRGILQVAPSFAGHGILLYPGHHPEHDADDLAHLTPQLSNVLYYSQEGHRPALHGAKHGSFSATFSRPTVVLDHSSYIRDVKCGDGHIDICFKSTVAFKRAENSWNHDDFNLVTYHMACGDQVSGRRTFFHAKHPVFNAHTLCVAVAVTRIDESEAVDSGKISWGTYQHPDHKKRVPVQGHVRIAQNGAAKSADSPDGYVDITQNAAAVNSFFRDPNIDTSQPDKPEENNDGLNFISEDGTATRRSLSRRQISARGFDLFGWVEQGLVYVAQEIVNFTVKVVEVVIEVAEVIVDVAIVAAKVIPSAFGAPFSHSYYKDVNINYYITAEATNQPPPIFGIGDGFMLAGSGETFSVQCAKCGIHGDFSVDGSLAFSIGSGITEGKVSFVNNDPFTVDAQFGVIVTLQYNAPSAELSQELGALPLSPFSIPGILSLGPQVSISSALDFSVSGHAELLIGGSLVISAGTASLSVVDRAENKLEGLETSFTPIFKANGSVSATLELGLLIALEAGIDVLSGKFKKTVGLINKPAIYATATNSQGEGHKCENGIELRAGVKNRIYVAALDLWEYDIRTDVLYEKGLGCVTPDGFDTNAVEPDQTVFDHTTTTLGGDSVGDVLPNVTDVASTLKPLNSTSGFRLIMDEAQTSILVSGQDGYIYLVKTEEMYDLSAPWGSIDIKSGILNLDVFGRIMSSKLGKYNLSAIVRVSDPSMVPAKDHTASLTILKTEQKDYEVYGVFLPNAEGTDVELFYPTFCATTTGLRLFATHYAFGEKGLPNAPNGEPVRNQIESLLTLVDETGHRVKDPNSYYYQCRTVRLTSNLTSADA